MNKLAVTVSIFLIIFTIIHMLKPTIMYNEDGGFRPFGVGYRHKTVIPIWLVSILVAIFSYLGVLYYLAYMWWYFSIQIKYIQPYFIWNHGNTYVNRPNVSQLHATYITILSSISCKYVLLHIEFRHLIDFCHYYWCRIV